MQFMAESAGVTSALSGFAANIKWSDLPDDVRDGARLALLDHLACAAGGVATDWGERARRATLRWPENGHATVLGEYEQHSPPTAAFLNGHYGNMLDFDDTLHDLGHPGTCIIPAALAVAEQEDRSFEELLAAIVAGYEVGGRFAVATRPDDAWFQELFPTSWHGIGPAVAAARLLGLDDEGIRAAIGIAAELVPASTPLTRETTYAFKSGKMGNYAATGVRAAYAAAEGLHGKRHALDPASRYWMSFGSNRIDSTLALDSLGERYVVQALSFKPFPSCRFTQSAIEAVLELRSTLGALPSESVRRIRVRTFTRALQLDEPAPTSAAHGPFCFPYLIAVAWLGVPQTEWYTATTRSSREVADLAQRVHLEADPTLDALVDQSGVLPTRVGVELDDGRTSTKEVPHPLGSPERPLTKQQIEDKFSLFMTPLLGPAQASHVLRSARTANLAPIRAFTQLLRPPTQVAPMGQN